MILIIISMVYMTTLTAEPEMGIKQTVSIIFF